MKDNLALRPTTFRRLEKELIVRGGLRHRRHVNTTEQLAIFLYQIVTNNSIRTTGERFQRSNETISRYAHVTTRYVWILVRCCAFFGRAFRSVLDAVLSQDFRAAYMKLPEWNDVPTRIRNDPKLFPYFKDCRGAIDGSHLAVNPPTLTRGRWRDREGNLTQNMLAICDFAKIFVYVLVGWEGGVADSSLYEHAQRHGGLHIPEGKYWIADAGFASCNTLLVPYRNVRYHLREWQIGNQR